MTANPLERPGTYVDSSPEHLLYEERHSAVGRPLSIPFWFGVGLMVVGVLLPLLGSTSFANGFTIGGAGWTAFWLAVIWAVWPIGIRVTTRRITVGALAFADGRDVTAGTRRDGTVRSRRWVYSCDWDGMGSVVVARGNAEGRRLGNEAKVQILHSPTGIEANPFARPLGYASMPGSATLAVLVDPLVAHYPRARQKRHKYWIPSPILGVPTRHPKKLLAALTSFPTGARLTDEVRYTPKRPSY